MALSKQKVKLFVYHELLVSELGTELLREFFSAGKVIENNCIIRGIDDGKLDIIPPTPAQKKLPTTDTAFQYFVQQKIVDGFIYASSESFKRILGV